MAGPGRSKLADTARLKLVNAPHNSSPFSHMSGNRARSSSPVSRRIDGELLEDRGVDRQLAERLRELAVEEEEQPAPDEGGQRHDHQSSRREAPDPHQQHATHRGSSEGWAEPISRGTWPGPSPSA